MIIIYFKRITDIIYNKEITNPNLLNYKSDKVQETKKDSIELYSFLERGETLKKIFRRSGVCF